MNSVASAFVALAACAMSVAAFADPVTVPHDFVDGTPADAAKINENFEALESEANDQEVRLDALEALPIGALQATACAWSTCFDAPEDMTCPAGKVAAGIHFPEWDGDESACTNATPNALDNFRVWCCQLSLPGP